MHRSKWAALLLVPALGLAGCSSGESDSQTSPSPATSSAAASGEEFSADGVTVTGAPGEEPTITVDSAAEPPSELVVEPITTGDGKAVGPNSQVTVQYTGVSWSNGQTFDTSWGRGAAQFPINGVITGWQEGLQGVTAGSRVLLIIPPEMAYGSNPPPGSGIAPDETLVFVVDVEEVSS
ncbi:MAG: FKBP-type peptidyl-prolyl cis-trans isomerase [Candidatus Nanopelagicales bacterium]|jgi:peptidylprolyl isomerase|nr:FKBP-type peptidyl-prolyl cis-trans isomerase [Candidatus Nanopelagicales bacterium]MCU0295365.1 FKBP-type peptidyl-prolyl cis-trans isomerase [Candidatus Nanopelagicales bacterium]MCU0297881.1 FKBP-type peptidyl-prolyl cis-trans isomerase [Candidatus Nanopelagicales bacterium]